MGARARREREPDGAPAAADVRLQLELWMRRSSIAVSIAAGTAMLVGLGSLLATGSLERFASAPALALSAWLHPAQGSFGLVATSFGIVLLSLLPGLRVLLAAALYAGRRAFIDALVALLVFVELVVSMLTGRG